MADIKLPLINNLELIKNFDKNKQFWVYDLVFKRPINYRDHNSDPATLSLSFKLVCGLRADKTGPTDPAGEEKKARELQPTQTRPIVTKANIRRRIVEKVIVDNNEVERKILVFLCGGPGASNQTLRNPALNEFYLKKGYWILYPDYRGTGDSTPTTGKPSQWVADNFKYMRQTDIVRDMESVRRFLLRNKKWSIIGQSFGGWISLTYLSFYWQGLKDVTITAGLAPIDVDIKKHFQKIYERLEDRNVAYYEKYDTDKKVVKGLVDDLLILTKENRAPRLDRQIPEKDTKLETGFLTAKRFLSLGRTVLGTQNKFSQLHELVDKLASEISDIKKHPDRNAALKDSTIRDFLELDGFKFWERPLAALLYESIFLSRKGDASNWAALHLTQAGGRGSKFYWATATPDEMSTWMKKQRSIYFSGEMIYPCCFEDYDELVRLDDRGESGNLADHVARYKWHEGLYDPEQLARNRVPIRALVYEKDIYVDRELSVKTANKVANLKYTVDEKLEHGSINTDTRAVLELLYDPKRKWTVSAATKAWT